MNDKLREALEVLEAVIPLVRGLYSPENIALNRRIFALQVNLREALAASKQEPRHKKCPKCGEAVMRVMGTECCTENGCDWMTTTSKPEPQAQCSYPRCSCGVNIHTWDGCMASEPQSTMVDKQSTKHEPQAQAGEPEVVKKICYSWNDEEYDCDSFGDLLDSADDPKVGDTYYEADCVTLEPTAGINSWTVDSLLEGMDEHIYEDIGECYDNECSDVSDEAKAELRALIENWAQKHINLSRYWKIVGKRREMKLTEDDLK